MYIRMLKKDLGRQKVVTAALFLFMMLSSLLLAGGSAMIIDLSSSLEALFENSRAPHLVQYHAGPIDQSAIDLWTSKQEGIAEQQTAHSINVEESAVYFKESEEPEQTGIMEMGFVRQNRQFDFLLDLENRIIELAPGEVAVPLYYMEKNDMKIGDSLRIEKGDFQRTYRTAAFVRDVQMNPSIISSKRFVLNDRDFLELQEQPFQKEYQIGFRFTDPESAPEFSSRYREAGLPVKGPTIDISLLKMVNALTDGLLAVLIILISLLLSAIALLCLRFTLLASMEEDTRDIGTMKAIGLRKETIGPMVLSKYLILGSAASLCGYLASLGLKSLFSSGISLSMGLTSRRAAGHLIPVLCAFLILLSVFLYGSFLLRRLDKISAVEVLRGGDRGRLRQGPVRLPLHKNRFLSTQVFIGLRDLVLRFRQYAFLALVFIMGTFIMIVPLNFLNTIRSPEFISCMGMGQSDVLIDLRQSEEMQESFRAIGASLEEDSRVERYASLVTGSYKVLDSQGLEENLLVGSGDPQVFPLEYLSGKAPVHDGEIALSSLAADSLGRERGDRLVLYRTGREVPLRVSGIYQDITNGGKTARVTFSPDFDEALWYTFNVDVDSEKESFIQDYRERFQQARVTGIEGYMEKTFRNTIDALKLLSGLSVITALLITLLITALFFRLLIARDQSQILIMRRMGFSLKDIRRQYMGRALLVLILGILAGTLLSNTLGQGLVSMLLSLRGASRIRFVIDPIKAYLFCPLGLMLAVYFSARMCIAALKGQRLRGLNNL